MNMKCFLSHSVNDKDFVDHLCIDLKAVGFDIWCRRFRAGIDLNEQIRKAITDAEIFIVILSDSSIISKCVRYEIDIAMQLQKRIFPITICQHHRLDNCGLDDLLRLYMPDFSRWSDADSYKVAFGQLIEGILGFTITKKDLAYIEYFSKYGNAYVHPVNYSYFNRGRKDKDGIWMMLECNYCLGQVYADLLCRQFRCSNCSSLNDHDYLDF